MTKEVQNQIKQTKQQLFAEIFRFLLVGGTATLVDYFVFWLFDAVVFAEISSTFTLIISTALGFCVGLTVNWLLSVSFVFRQVQNKEEVRSKKSFLIFTIIGVLGLLITELGMVGLVALFPSFSLFGRTQLLGTGWDKWLAKVIMTCLVLIWNYVGRKLFVFK